jgi:glucokinase
MGTEQTPLYAGLDVGGTNIAAALVQESGEVCARARVRTPRQGGEETLAAIIRAVEELLQEGGVAAADLAAIGVGIAGVVEPESGRVVVTPNMELSGLQVVQPLQERFGVLIALGNDVNLGTLGEKWLGAARDAGSAVGIFVGTGIGGGIVCDGRLMRGARHAAGEIGHIVMQIDGPLCGCGNRGCLEALASRSAMERDIREAVAAGRETALTDILDADLSRIKSGAFKKALKRDDPLVKEVLGAASEVIGYACLTVRHLLDPEVIVLGGGVVEACADFVMPIVQGVVDSDALPGAREGGRIVESELGDDAGVLGAAALAMAALEDADGDEAYPVIQRTSFGEVTVAGETHARDIYIRANGKVKKRKKKRVKELYGTSHKIGPEELRKVCKGDPELLIIGTGQQGAAVLTREGERYLRERGVRFKAAPTPEAVRQYNAATARKAALIHVTC